MSRTAWTMIAGLALAACGGSPTKPDPPSEPTVSERMALGALGLVIEELLEFPVDFQYDDTIYNLVANTLPEDSARALLPYGPVHVESTQYDCVGFDAMLWTLDAAGDTLVTSITAPADSAIFLYGEAFETPLGDGCSYQVGSDVAEINTGYLDLKYDYREWPTWLPGTTPDSLRTSFLIRLDGHMEIDPGDGAAPCEVGVTAAATFRVTAEGSLPTMHLDGSLCGNVLDDKIFP